MLCSWGMVKWTWAGMPSTDGENETRRKCRYFLLLMNQINIYNFLADSFKYNRMNDINWIQMKKHSNFWSWLLAYNFFHFIIDLYRKNKYEFDSIYIAQNYIIQTFGWLISVIVNEYVYAQKKIRKLFLCWHQRNCIKHDNI